MFMDNNLKIYTTLGYIVSLILLNLGHVFRFRIVSRKCHLRVVYIFKFKMFHQETSVETIKLFTNGKLIFGLLVQIDTKCSRH